MSEAMYFFLHRMRWTKKYSYRVRHRARTLVTLENVIAAVPRNAYNFLLWPGEWVMGFYFVVKNEGWG